MEPEEEVSKKRSRDDGITLPREEEEEDGDMQQPLLKRGFCLLPWPDSMEDHLHLLEDLCSGEESAAAAREDLVSEMMKTLENVINDNNTAAAISAMASSAPPPCSFAAAVNGLTAMADSVELLAAGSPPLSWHFEAAPPSEERGDTSVKESTTTELTMEEGIVVKDSLTELLTESDKKGVAKNESLLAEKGGIDLTESAAVMEENGIAAAKAAKESFDIAFLLEASDDELGIQPLMASNSCDSSSSIMSDSFPESEAFCEAMDRNREEAATIGTEESISWLDGDGDGHPSVAEEMGRSFPEGDLYMTLSQESENELALGRDWGGEIVEENEESEEENDENSWYLQEQQRLLLGLERNFCC